MPRKMYTAEELCALSGLSCESLAELKAAGLLLPNAAGQYRSKLVTWARKLVYLLDAGWSLPEIKTWAHARWSTPSPGQWRLPGSWLPQEGRKYPNRAGRICRQAVVMTDTFRQDWATQVLAH
jgi:hypothetical protein